MLISLILVDIIILYFIVCLIKFILFNFIFYLDMIGALVSTLANLLTNETDVVRSVAPGLPLDVL